MIGAEVLKPIVCKGGDIEMIVEDERSEREKFDLTTGIAATDAFLSGWGCAKNGVSYVVWACKPEDADRVFRWVKNRPEMKRVRIVDLKTYRPRGPGHCSIYAVREGHRALQ